MKNWNLLEKTILTLAVVVPVTLGIILQSSLIQIGASSLMVISALFFAKVRIEGFFLSAIAMILLAIVAWGERLYGEVSVIVVFGLPALVVGFISWLKSRKKDDPNKPSEIEIRKTRPKELVILISICAALSVGVYFLLQAVDTNQLELSTFSVVSTIFATVLVVRRSHFGTLGFVINDISNIFLWLMIVFAGNSTAIVMIVNPALLLVSDIYGVFKWRKISAR